MKKNYFYEFLLVLMTPPVSVVVGIVIILVAYSLALFDFNGFNSAKLFWVIIVDIVVLITLYIIREKYFLYSTSFNDVFLKVNSNEQVIETRHYIISSSGRVCKVEFLDESIIENTFVYKLGIITVSIPIVLSFQIDEYNWQEIYDKIVKKKYVLNKRIYKIFKRNKPK